MKKIICIIIGCFSLIIFSCDDFLTVTPTDFLNPDVFFQNEEQTSAALNTIYSTLSSFDLYGDKMLSELALHADEGFNTNISPSIGNVRFYDVSTSDKDIYGFWKVLYRGIDKANFFLENIHRPDINETKRSVMKGEGLFLRAYFYFLLVQHFGPVPLKIDASKTAESGYLERSPVKDVYDQIWSDLVEAEKLVTSINELGFGGRVSKSAVQGIMARVALYMAGHPLQDKSKWGEAKYWAAQVINSGLHELNPNYEQIFINYAQDKYDYKESIFEVEFWGNYEPPYQNAGRVGLYIGGPLYHKNVSDIYGVSYGRVNCTKWLYDLYPEGDIRRDRNIANYMFNSSTGAIVDRSSITPYGRYARKWDRRDESESTRTYANSPQNFPILRYADVLLMFAEANNEIGGNIDSTYLCINMVRRRGMKANVEIPSFVDVESGLDQIAIRQIIRDERAKELCYETLRKGDVVRWGIFYERMQFAHAEMSEAPGWGTNVRKAYFSNATHRDTLWPIPELERGLNNLLTQNSGW